MGRAGSGLASALGLAIGEMVAFVGAGGKTTTAWRLLEELSDARERAVFTTTTRVFKPSEVDVPLILNPQPTGAEVERVLESARGVVLAAGLGERGDPERVAWSPYPAGPVKLVGLAAGVLNRLSRELPSVTWLVEADGAKGRLLKAPAAYEPVIPSEADRVVALGGLDAIGKPLGEGTVHRSEIAAQLLGVSTGVRITPKLLARLLGHPSGGMKGIPPDAEAVVLLTQWNEPDGTDGGSIAEGLLRTGRVARVVQADLRVPDPVLALWYP